MYRGESQNNILRNAFDANNILGPSFKARIT